MQRAIVLVYQAGLANVFEVTHPTRHPVVINNSGVCEARGRAAIRLLQADFRSCEFFARGAAAAGRTVYTMWCNEAGDITNRDWRFTGLEDAPFSDRFCPVAHYEFAFRARREASAI